MQAVRRRDGRRQAWWLWAKAAKLAGSTRALWMLLGCATTLACAQPRTPADLLACANGNLSRCRAAAARAGVDEADALREWACTRGDTEACLERLVASRACAERNENCPLVGESLGEAGVLASRSCDAGSVLGCAFARQLGHRSGLVLGTTHAESGGNLLGFLDQQHLLTAGADLTLWRLTPTRPRQLQRLATRPLLERTASGGPAAYADIAPFVYAPDGRAFAVVEVSSRRYLWTLGTGEQPPPRQLPEPVLRAAFTPNAGALLTCVPTSDGQRYGVSSIALRLYDPSTTRLILPGLELAAPAERVAASNERYAALELAGVHLFDRRFGSHTLLRPRGIPSNLAFSHDGRWLATTSDQAVQLYDVSGAAQLVATRSGHFGAVAFSENGSRLAVETGRGVLLLEARTLDELSPELQTRSPWEPSVPWDTQLLFDPSGSTLFIQRAGQVLVVSLAESPSNNAQLPLALVDAPAWFNQLAPLPLASLFDGKAPRNWNIRGTVTLDQQPVPGAKVELVPNMLALDLPYPEWRSKAAELASPRPAATTTDAAGHFRFVDVPWIPWSLEVTQPGLVQQWLGPSVAYSPGQDSPATIRMARCAALRGRVSLANGAAGAGFKVLVTGETDWLAEAKTDSEGRYSLDCLRPSSAHLEAIGPNGEAAYRHIELQSSLSSTEDLSAQPFEAKGLERLVVVGDDGQPMADAEVKGYPGNDRTSQSGRWSSARPARLPPLVAYRGRLIEPKRVGGDEPWTLRLPTAELFVTHPKLAAGDSMTLGRVTSTGTEYANGIEESAGTRFSGLAGGRWTLWHVDDRGRLGTASIQLAPRQAARIDPPHGSVEGIPLTGVVIDEDSGKPVLGASVRASCFNAPNNGGGGRPLRIMLLETDPAGRFRIPCLARDRHTFSVSKNGYLDQQVSVDARNAGTSLAIAPVRLRRARPNVIRRLLRGP